MMRWLSSPTSIAKTKIQCLTLIPGAKVWGLHEGALAAIRDPHLAGFSKTTIFLSHIQANRTLELWSRRSRRRTRLQIKSPAQRLPHHTTLVACRGLSQRSGNEAHGLTRGGKDRSPLNTRRPGGLFRRLKMGYSMEEQTMRLS